MRGSLCDSFRSSCQLTQTSQLSIIETRLGNTTFTSHTRKVNKSVSDEASVVAVGLSCGRKKINRPGYLSRKEAVSAANKPTSQGLREPMLIITIIITATSIGRNYTIVTSQTPKRYFIFLFLERRVLSTDMHLGILR